MPSQLLGSVAIDQTMLQRDIERSSGFEYFDPYPEFLRGRPWRSCVLWAAGGEVGDGVITHYDLREPPAFTTYGKLLPYVRCLIEETFDLDHLLFARLAVMTDAVLIPHRDYVEFADAPPSERAGHRIHIPLVTDETCLFSEDDVVFHMRGGELWFLDAARRHSAAVLSGIDRIHLILDFDAAGDRSGVLRVGTGDPAPGIPASHVPDRPSLPDEERAQLVTLSTIIDLENLRDVFAILVKKHFRWDGGDDFVWRTMHEIARRSGRPEVRAELERLHRHFLLTRDE